MQFRPRCGVVTASMIGLPASDAATAKEVAVLRGHDGECFRRLQPRRLAGSHDFDRDKTARIWDAATAKEIAVLRGHDGAVDAPRSAPTGRALSRRHRRDSPHLDAATAKEIAVLRGHRYDVHSAAFSPDGSRIVTASWDDKTARIWDAHLQTMSVKGLLAEACARLAGLTKLTRDEMRLAGYPDSMPEIDVCP